VLAGHVFLALINPTTRPALRGMLTGRVDRAWAVRHHPRWVAEVDALQRPAPGRSATSG
jgi:formate dehydrogenase subunit gamma